MEALAREHDAALAVLRAELAATAVQPESSDASDQVVHALQSQVATLEAAKASADARSKQVCAEVAGVFSLLTGRNARTLPLLLICRANLNAKRFPLLTCPPNAKI